MDDIDKGVLIAQAAFCELDDLHPCDIERIRDLDDERFEDLLDF